jgi:DNA-binding CsgD family transcriptional regulator
VPAPKVALHAGQLLQRDGELAALEARLDAAVAGRGGVAVVTGPLGIGKTALLSTLRASAQSRGITVLSARGAPLERDYPYAVVRRLFEPLGLETGAATDPDLLAGAAAQATRAFATGAPVTDRPEDVSFATVHGLYWLTVNLAARAPILLVVDDCHWSDVASLRYLAYLGARLDELNALLLVAVRAGEQPLAPDLLTELSSLADVPVQPAPLDAGPAADLVREHLGERATDRFCLACHRATGGNPLLLRTLVRSFGESGGAPDDRAAGEVVTFGAGSVGRILGRRLSHLPTGAREVVAALAILGPGAPMRHVAALAGLDVAAAAGVTDALRAAAVLAPGPDLDFAHPVLAAAVEDGMSATDRALAHDRAARLLADDGAPAELCAVHLLHTVARGEPDTVETLRRAAGQALDRGAPETAAVYLRRALEEPAPAAARGPLRLELGLALLAARRDPVAGDLIRTGVFEFEPPDRLGAALRAARALGVAGYFDEAATFDALLAQSVSSRADPRAQSVSSRADGPAGRDEAMERLLEAEILAGNWLVAARIPAALERCARYDAASLPDDVGGHMLRVNLAHRSLLAAEPAGIAIDLIQRAIASGELLGEESLINTFVAMDLIAADECDRAEEICTQIIQEGRRRGSPSLVASFSFPRSFAALRRGALAEAEADARISFDRKLAMGPPEAVPWPLGFLVDSLVAMGAYEAAERALAQAPSGATPPETMAWAFVIQARGHLRVAQARTREAVDDLLEAGARWERLVCRGPGMATWRADAVPVLARLGELAEARRLADEALRIAHATGLPRAIGQAIRSAAALAPAEERVGLLTEAVARLRDCPARLELAAGLVDLGATLRRAGRRSDARAPLREGLDLAFRAGARPLADRAHAELLAAGARPRRPVLTGLEALTVSERRVASLATEGLTNREIAERLFVTQRTVETHLQHAFGKLGLHRREDLPAALARPARSEAATR